MYNLIIDGQLINIGLSLVEAVEWQQVLRGRFSQENVEIIGWDGQPVGLCIFCEQPTLATRLLGDWEVCEGHTNSLTADPVCDECGGPLSEEDVEAGETICGECAPAVSTLSVSYMVGAGWQGSG